MVPTVWLFAKPKLKPGDTGIALKPIGVTPLGGLRTGSSFVRTLILSIPNDKAWRRIRRAWGDPTYLVAVLAVDQRTITCFNRLGLHLDISLRSRPVQSTISDHIPYGYLPKCASTGLEIHASPGDSLEIRISGTPDTVMLEMDTLAVVPYWSWGMTKDRLVGIELDKQLQPSFLLAGSIGATLFSLSLYRLSKLRWSSDRNS